jgi:hypothetical protein
LPWIFSAGLVIVSRYGDLRAADVAVDRELALQAGRR